jgi:hypothetical protein
MSVSPRNNSVPAARIFIKFDIKSISRKYVEEIQVKLKSRNNNEHFKTNIHF